MGQSTNAMLVFGVELDEENAVNIALLKRAYQKLGIIDKFEDCLDEEMDDDDEYLSDVPWDLVKHLENFFGLTIETHCSDEYPMYILCLKGAPFNRTANRGNALVIDDPLPKPNDLQMTQLKNIMNILEAEGEPSWLLASYWG